MPKRRYHVELKPSADKALAKFPLGIQKRPVLAMEALAGNPRPGGIAKIADDDSLWRIRVGEYRIVYEIHDAAARIAVLRVAHRKDVSRKGT
jgi:mRNA interferase RelE/StbE